MSQLASLQHKIDPERFAHMMYRQTYQAGHALVWRDAISDFYWNMTGVADQHGRVGHHPNRISASSMRMQGYKPYVVSPFEAATPLGYTAVVTSSNSTPGSVETTLDFEAGTYDLGVNYYDLYGGRARYTMCLNGEVVGRWRGDAEDHLGHTPSVYLDGHSAIRKTWYGVEVKRGDVLRIVGVPDGDEPAPLDYVVLLPEGMVD